MSLAHKLWKIGSVLTKDDVEQTVRTDAGFKDGVEPVYLNIDFSFKDNHITDISLNKYAISRNRLFFTKKIGGTSNAYYLYPNVEIQKKKPSKGIKNIKNTLKYSTIKFCNDINANYIKAIREHLEEALNDNSLDNYPKDNYLIWLSINGKTFHELMPEVWENYYDNPFPKINTKVGFDIFTNEKAEIGYETDFKCYSYDQYHKSMEYRLDDNLPLSKVSARNIKYAWMYILKNLVFYYKGLEYIIIPNMLNNNKEMLRIVLKKFVIARKKSSNKLTILKRLRKQEKELNKEIEKMHRRKVDATESKNQLRKINNEIKKTDLGLVNEFHEQTQTLEELINSVTLDYIFTNINKTNLSFDINGTIEDVIPSKMSKVVKYMRKYKIEDLVKLGSKDREKTYLQDYFNRNELYFALNRSASKNSNSINSERLFLARLLLSDVKIKQSDLLQRFELNRNYGYDKKKRRTKEGFQEWIQYPSSFVEDEKKMIQFLQNLNKIQED